jgi:hypothetical protein
MTHQQIRELQAKVKRLGKEIDNLKWDRDEALRKLRILKDKTSVKGDTK